MADTAAERQRRSRQHKAGDHSLCLPGRCVDASSNVTGDVTRDVVTSGREAKLGKAGRALWNELAGDGRLSAVEATILLEACRTVDTLERLDGILRGRDRTWLQIEVPEGGGDELVLVVDKALSERRQQQVTLKSLLAEFRQTASRKPAEKPPVKGGGGLGDLTARIAARRAMPAG